MGGFRQQIETPFTVRGAVIESKRDCEGVEGREGLTDDTPYIWLWDRSLAGEKILELPFLSARSPGEFFPVDFLSGSQYSEMWDEGNICRKHVIETCTANHRIKKVIV